jgi:LytS/YehU family sensor histidine kinase
VPSLILQPLVENAVVHGMAGHQGAVAVRVTVNVIDDVIALRVTNSMAQDRSVGADGIGLKNVRERMAVQFEGYASLSAAGVDGEWVSEIRMPIIRESPPMSRESPVGRKLQINTLFGT